MKLHEIVQNPQHERDQQRNFQITEWLYHARIENYTIRPNGIVDVDGDVRIKDVFINGTRQTTIPVQFGTVSGNFDCSDIPIQSLVGSPHHVGKAFKCYGTNITTVEGAPHYIGRRFVCFQTPSLHSLTGIHKIIKHIGTEFIGPSGNDVHHILGILLIPGITLIQLDTGQIDKIMNKYLPTHNVIMAQDELIDAGFIEQAKL